MDIQRELRKLDFLGEVLRNDGNSHEVLMPKAIGTSLLVAISMSYRWL